jgi:hypothetical protein
MIVLVIKISTLIFTLPNPDTHPHLESAFGMRFPDADPDAEIKIMRMRICYHVPNLSDTERIKHRIYLIPNFPGNKPIRDQTVSASLFKSLGDCQPFPARTLE